MDAGTEIALRNQLEERRARLTRAAAELGPAPDLERLLRDVDSALKRMDSGVFGRCEVCSEQVEPEFLFQNPTITYCLCALSAEQQSKLQMDLDLASRIQWSLLPQQDLICCGWEAHFRYRPAGPVSGDYCDVVDNEAGLYFLVGDVSGKGVAASFVMAHLSALFRSLIAAGMPVDRLMERANRLLGENKIASHYATMLCGRAQADGTVELCNAGHPAAVAVTAGSVQEVRASGPPIGLFGGGEYTKSELKLVAGDALVLYTDGVTEAVNAEDDEYGTARLRGFLREQHGRGAREIATGCVRDLEEFRGGAEWRDDLTILVLGRGA